MDFTRLAITLSLGALLVTGALGTPRHKYRHRHNRVIHHHVRHMHRHHAVKAAVSIRDDLVPAEISTSTIFQIMTNADWQTMNQRDGEAVPIASRDTAIYIRANHKDNLNEFGTAKVIAADMLRFTDPSIVLSNASPDTLGIVGERRTGWNGADEEREGRFQAEFSDMLTRAKIDEERYHAKGG